jgi:GntR family transcriptional repressor for pyruvate dehydrogenase complex
MANNFTARSIIGANGELETVDDTREHNVVEALESILVQLPLGSHLPSEHDLATTLGVSRLTVREALKTLSGRGLADIRQGRRAIVTEPSSGVISHVFTSHIRRDPTALLELTEVRMALEVQSASLAARKASRAGLAAIEASLQEMAYFAERYDQLAPGDERDRCKVGYQQADLIFHESIALASGNRMLGQLLEALEDSLLQSFHASFESHVSDGGRASDGVASHAEILVHISDGDADKAGQAMRRQLEFAEHDLKKRFFQAGSNTTQD